MACPPPSPLPRGCICDNPVGCGEMARDGAEEPCDIPLYLSKMVSEAHSTSNAQSERFMQEVRGSLTDTSLMHPKPHDRREMNISYSTLVSCPPA